MWKPIYDPGTWKAYLNKKENKGLPIMEVRKKYLEEQLEFEDFRGLVSSTLSPSLASSAASAVGDDGGKGRNVPSIFPPVIYSERLLRFDNLYRTEVDEWIKYEEGGDSAWNGKPVYFTSQNIVDIPNYDYDPNGVFGAWMRWNAAINRWETKTCEYDRENVECEVSLSTFGVPIPDVGSPIEWGNLIGEWDVPTLKSPPWGWILGCYTTTWVGPGPGPKQTNYTLVEYNTYTEDPGTATYGTNYSYQESGSYVLPEGVYNGDTSLACGEEPQPCDSLFNVVELRGGDGLQKDLAISDESELVNGRRYWDKLVGGKGSVPGRLYTIRWNGNNWEIVYQEGSDPEIIISTNTNHTGEIPYGCSGIKGDDSTMTWTGDAPYENGFTTEGTGGEGDKEIVRVVECTAAGIVAAGETGIPCIQSDVLFNNKRQWIADPKVYGPTMVRWNSSLGDGGSWQVTYPVSVFASADSINTDIDYADPYGDGSEIVVYEMSNGDYYRVLAPGGW